jgi:hypothetical protein
MSIRLINTDTIRLTSFMGDRIPKYAILSHTWDHNEELSFQDMQAVIENCKHPAAMKSGYYKIVETCRKARENGIAYAWVDTCCIDKTSSSELSEAINSMYQWYQQAQTCYVFLSDFEGRGAVLETALSGCRWFTRGWCLQELLAPQHVQFFDKHWNHIGSKMNLKSIITKITQIDEEVLVDNSLIGSVAVARKMSWAAGRETTREEDIAYCLLGIFDVNMPMLYGEGSKAFLRLQKEIIHQSNDLSIFAFLHERQSQAPSSLYSAWQKYCNLFATSPRDFISCSTLKYTRAGAFQSKAFALTNKGLYFRQIELQVDVQHGSFSLILNCEDAKFKDARMYLCKVGPGLYASYDNCRFDTWISPDGPERNNYTTMEEEVYVITTITPSAQPQLQHADDYAIHVRSRSHDLSRALQAIQRAPSSNRWDASRMLFLTSGEKSVRAFWKVFPCLARWVVEPKNGKAIPPQPNFYLVSGLEHHEDDAQPQAWLCVYSSEEWKNLEGRLGIITNLDDVADHADTGSTSYRMETPSIVVTASIQLEIKEEKPRFELQVDLKIKF